MSWSRSVGHWAELKGKAKKHLDKFKDFESDDTAHKPSQHFNKTHEPRKNIEDRADEHMSNLYGLLSNMKGYNNVHSEMLKTYADDDSYEVNKKSFKSI